MPKDKRRMIDADVLLAKLEQYKIDNHHHQTLGYFAVLDCIDLIKNMLSVDSTCDFRNPGWEERAKEHDS